MPTPDPQPLERVHPRSLKHLSHALRGLVERRLWLKVIIAMGLGVVVGIALGPTTAWVSPDVSNVVGAWVALPGKIFVGLLQMIVVPLIFASIIRGLASTENVEQLKQLGLRTVAFFLATTTFALGLGISLALAIEPGRFVDSERVRATFEAPAQWTAGPIPTTTPTATTLPSMLSELIPTNPLGAMVDAQMLQVVLFTIFLGVALITLPARDSRPLLDLLGSLQSVSMTVVRWAMSLAPLAVFGLMVRTTSSVGLETLLGLTAYVGTVLLGLALVFGAYLLLNSVVERRSPFSFLRRVREVLLLAFSTSSSAAVMPLSITTAEELEVRSSVAQFVIPLGATINMTGTALYQGAATVFLLQIFAIDLSLGGLVLLVATALGASIGASATPAVSMIILAMVLGSVGVPIGGVALVMGVDRLLDMVRTAVNVTGDLVACRVIDRWASGSSLEELREREAEHEAERAETGVDVIVEP